jgi:hypothetical protein
MKREEEMVGEQQGEMPRKQEMARNKGNICKKRLGTKKKGEKSWSKR